MNEENNTNSIDNTNSVENITENSISNEIEHDNNTTQTNSYIEQQENLITLQEIHNDLGIITSFLIFFVLVVILKYVYKFFNMFFVI